MGSGGTTAALAATALLLCAGPAGATAIAKAVEPTIGEQIYAAAKLYDQGRCERAAPVLDNAMSRAEFKSLDVRVLPLVYEMAASCAAATGDGEKGLAMARAGTAYDSASDRLWALRLGLAIDLRVWDDAVQTIEVFARARPKLLNALEVAWLSRLDRGLQAGGAPTQPLRRRLIATLGGGAYVPDQPFSTADGWRLAYGTTLAEANDRAGARKVLAGLTAPERVIEAAVDVRTADLGPDPAGLPAAVERRLAEHRAALAAHPDLLEGVIAVSRDLRLLGRADEAVALLEETAPRLAAAPGFTDLEGQRTWFWNERAWALWDAGRLDAAIEAMTAASALPEEGGPNVSQTINLAELLVDAGRPDAALKTLERFGTQETRASNYGLMWVAAVRACAYAVQARAEPLQIELEKLKANAAVNEAALANALLCAKDIDGAAAAYVRRLQDPASRAAALIALSEFDRPVQLTPHRRALAHRLGLVRARPEVQEAVARAGRTLRVPLRSAYWGEF